jgi:hypothetical protein
MFYLFDISNEILAEKLDDIHFSTELQVMLSEPIQLMYMVKLKFLL